MVYTLFRALKYMGYSNDEINGNKSYIHLAFHLAYNACIHRA